MLAVLRFSFSKELKFVRARLGKPYNSALGTSLPSTYMSESDTQVNTFAVPGIYPHCWSMSRPRNQSFGPTFTSLSPVNQPTVVKEEVDGRPLSSGQKMEDGHRARLGMSTLPYVETSCIPGLITE
jgi:hypothetical protein